MIPCNASKQQGQGESRKPIFCEMAAYLCSANPECNVGRRTSSWQEFLMQGQLQFLTCTMMMANVGTVTTDFTSFRAAINIRMPFCLPFCVAEGGLPSKERGSFENTKFASPIAKLTKPRIANASRHPSYWVR